MTQVSIIVPVYNSENTLERCISSLLNQTYKDYELLIINDGSTDRSAEICDSYATKDDRIKVFHKQNGGVSSARNQGLDNVSGKWVTFVDSDDWVDELYLESLLNSSENVDLVIGTATYVNHPRQSQIKYAELLVIPKEYYRLFTDYNLRKRTSPWNKLYRHKIIDDYNIRFPLNVHIGEDAVFLYTFLLYSTNIRCIESRHYYYLYDSVNSLTKRIHHVSMEILAMNAIYTSVENLIFKRNIVDTKAVRELHILEATYVHRVLNSLYFYQSSQNERLAIISKLDIKTYCLYYLSYHSTWFNNLLSMVLRNNQYIIYDYIRRFVKLIKYKNWIR